MRRPEGTLRRWRPGKGPPCYKLEGQWAYIEEEVIEWVRAPRITFSVRDEHLEREAARVSLWTRTLAVLSIRSLNGTVPDTEDQPSKTQSKSETL